MPILEKVCISSCLGIFQVTVTATAAATASQELSHLARPLAYHAQGANIPFRNPSLRRMQNANRKEEFPQWCCRRRHLEIKIGRRCLEKHEDCGFRRGSVIQFRNGLYNVCTVHV